MTHNIRGLFNSLSVSEYKHVNVINKFYFLKLFMNNVIIILEGDQVSLWRGLYVFI